MATARTPAPQIGTITVALDFAYTASAAKVWRALTLEINRWWPKSFFCAVGTNRFFVEPRIGGRLGETGPRGAGLLWATVVGVTPGRILDMVGQVTPAWGGPAIDHLRFEVVPAGKGATLCLRQVQLGTVDASKIAVLEQGWYGLFGVALRAFLEKKKKRR